MLPHRSRRLDASGARSPRSHQTPPSPSPPAALHHPSPPSTLMIAPPMASPGRPPAQLPASASYRRRSSGAARRIRASAGKASTSSSSRTSTGKGLADLDALLSQELGFIDSPVTIVESPSSPISPGFPRAPPKLAVERLDGTAVVPAGAMLREEDGVASPVRQPTADDMILGLLASQASLDATKEGWTMMGFEEVEESKKELQHLATRISALTHKLSLEIKIRDAALSLHKASARSATSTSFPPVGSVPPTPLSFGFPNLAIPPSPASPSPAASLPSPLLPPDPQHQAELESATRKIEAVRVELYRLVQREASVRRKLLEHNAAALAARVSRLEEDGAEGGGRTRRGSDGSADTSTIATSVSSVGYNKRFEGPHLFADASSSPAAKGAAAGSGSVMAHVASLEAQVHELESVSEGLRNELDDARAEAEQLEEELSSARQASRAMEKAHAALRDARARAETLENALAEERRRVEEELDGRHKHFEAAELRARQEADELREQMRRSAEEREDTFREMEVRLGELAREADIAKARLLEGEQEVALSREHNTAVERRVRAAEERLKESVKRCAKLLGKDDGREEMELMLERIKLGQARERNRDDLGRDFADLMTSMEEHLADIEHEILTFRQRDWLSEEGEGGKDGDVAAVLKAERNGSAGPETTSQDAALERVQEAEKELKESRRALAELRKLVPNLPRGLTEGTRLALKMAVESEGEPGTVVSSEGMEDEEGARSDLEKKEKEWEEKAKAWREKETKLNEELSEMKEKIELIRGEKRRLEVQLSATTGLGTNNSHHHLRGTSTSSSHLSPLPSPVNPSFSLGGSPRSITLGMDSNALAARVRELERELRNVASMRAKASRAAELEAELEEMKQDLADAQDELDEIKGKEQKQRIQLLDEMNQLQQDLATARAQLRQGQRRNKAGPNAADN